MKNLLSYILIFVMMISCFFGGFAKTPEDLAVNGDNNTGFLLTDEEKEILASVVESETAWIASLQLDNGAIPMTYKENGEVTVNPYFADFAAMALLDNADKYSENVKAYMDWHFGHLNSAKSDYNGVDATIYDYTVTVKDGKVVSEAITVKDGKNSYDSTDSYAATFLMLLNKYYEVTGDIEYISAHKDDIIRVTEAMLSTLNRGLTYAKPDYEVKYLMDNCEVYEGLLCALNLFEKTDIDCGNITLKKSSYALKWIEQNIENKLWVADENHYHAGIVKNGNAAYEFSWSEFYPSATAQLFPVIHGVIPADSIRADSLYNSFCDEYNWQTLDIPSEFCWGAMVYAAAIMGDTDSVMAYMDSYSDFAFSREYPLYNADAARVSMAANILLSNADSD